MSERRWRSAANRPRRQPRRGWETEKTSQMKQASRVQQKFNSPKISLLPNESLPTPTPPFPQKIPPHAPPSQPRSDPGFFGPIWIRSGLLGVRNGLFWVDSRLSRAKPGPIWVRTGLFWVDSGSIPGFPGSKSCCFGPPSPPGNPSPHRETCKNFTSQPEHPSAPSPPRFPKIAQNII